MSLQGDGLAHLRRSGRRVDLGRQRQAGTFVVPDDAHDAPATRLANQREEIDAAAAPGFARRLPRELVDAGQPRDIAEDDLLLRDLDFAEASLPVEQLAHVLDV